MRNKGIGLPAAGASVAAISAVAMMVVAVSWTTVTRADDTPAQKAAQVVLDQAEGSGTWTAPDQVAAKKRANEVVPFVETVVEECLLCRQQKLRELGLSTADIPNTYSLLDSPIIKAEENQYGPVRFMHARHASQANDCAVCHHYRPADPEALETTRCSACHQEASKSDYPDRVGLKAAYHTQCMNCHKEQNKGPVDCIGCHAKNMPDHRELVNLPDDPAPEQVTAECLICHPSAGEDMLTSAHWLWKGRSPYTMEHRKEAFHGKATTVFNNY